MSTEAEPNGEPTGEAKFKRGIRGKAKFLLYFNHFLIGWDEHIWSFALSLFLVEITPQSLTFIASYGLVAGIAVLLFGTVVGDWVDRTHRLTVARVSVLVQNLALIVCCLVVYVVIEYKNPIAEVLPGQGLLRMCYAIIILIAILSNLSNMARTTAIERDWIVEICDRDADMLADLSATMRRISLVTMVITPIITGQILSRTSHSTGALVVAGWNFMTIFLEYYLLLKIYNEVPQLQRRKVNAPQHAVIEFTHVSGLDTAAPIQELEEEPREAIAMTNEDNPNAIKTYKALSRPTENERTFVQTICATFFTFRRGWRVYKNYDVAFAGLALSSLYLTVLGFHHTTVGFAYAQGLSEDLIGGLLATAAFTGIIGTFLYPIVRKAIGLQSTGLYALAAEVTCLTLCVASVFVPGSPFDPGYFSRREPIPEGVITLDTGLLLNQTGIFTGNYSGNASTPSSVTMEPEMTTTSYWSISLLLTGIIAARVGLWMADLTITQLFLESVDVTERGIVAGVQNALNQLMDMLKYAIVILLPVPEVFGYLVIISFCFICLGWVLFAIYVKRARGYVLYKKSHR